MRRLGCDIGTNSIGWCLTEDDGRIVDIGVRIFSDGRDPKSGASLAVDRRAARAMRRRRDRYLRRRSVFLEALVRHGLMPADSDEAKLIAENKIERWRGPDGKWVPHLPYVLRARAPTERLEPYEIGRALFHLNQRRGFLSNRKAERKQKPGEEGKIASGAKALDQAMAEAGADTIGQFLAGRDEKRVRMDSEAQAYDFYPERRHLLYEFQSIWDSQLKHHRKLLTQSPMTWDQLAAQLARRDKNWHPAEARDNLYRILFFQRELKEQDVGFCLFAGRDGVPRDEERLPRAHPLFQQRRLYEEVNQLEIVAAGEPSRKLTIEQRDDLMRALRHKRTVRYTALAKTLKLKPGESFNKASDTRIEMLGDEVYFAMARPERFGDAWGRKSADEQWAIIRRLLDEEDPDALHAFLTGDCGLDEAHAIAIAKATLPEGHGRIGETASRRILAELKKDVVTYARAVELAGWHHSDERTGEVLKRLPYYGELLSREIPPGSFDPADADNPELYWGKITNPTVHIGMRQLEKLVNAIIAVHGRPDQIVVELARELKLNERDKEEHNKRIRKDTADAQRRSRLLRGVDASEQRTGEPVAADTGANRALLKLWEELNPANVADRRCPYCAEQIGMRQLFTEAQVDHIVPYSRSLDDSTGNKVVVHRRCNQQKGNKTPYEKWGPHLDPDRWDRIATQVARLSKSKQWRFGPDAMSRVEKDGGFLARQLTDTQYLSRLAGKYLRSLYPEADGGGVYVIPGRMTAMLRRLWGLNSILPDHNYVENKHSDAPKNRLDHRHHAIDAAVTAVTTRGLLQRIARTAGLAEDKDLNRLFEDLEQPWPGFREELQERLLRTTVSHKADHGRQRRPSRHRDSTAGRLHNDTAYGLTGEVARDGRTPIVVHRVPLLSLKAEDISNPDRIPDAELREALRYATHGTTGKAFEAALGALRKHGAEKKDKNGDPLFKGLRHIRVREPLTVIPISNGGARPFKAYAGASNDRFNIWRLPDGSWTGNVVPTFEAHQTDYLEVRPHPAAKKIMSLRQNDLIAVERGGGPREIMRVIKFTLNGQMAIVAHNETGKLADRHKDPGDSLQIVNPTVSGLKKMKARQVRIDPLGRIFDPGPR